MEDLAAHECVAFQGSSDPAGAWVFATKDGPVTAAIRSRIVLDTMESVVDAGIAGMGLVRVFCYHVRPVLRAGLLRAVLPGFVPPALPVHAIHPGGELLPLKVRAFLDYCVPRLEARLAI